MQRNKTTGDKSNGTFRAIRFSEKFILGGRKHGQSMHKMSIEALLEEQSSSNLRPRDKAKLAFVLARKGYGG